MIQLRPYQVNGNRQAHTLLNGFRSPILVMPTGTGKTKTATVFISERIELKNRVFVLTRRYSIIIGEVYQMRLLRVLKRNPEVYRG